MKKKTTVPAIFLAALLGLAVQAAAGPLTGSLKGRITDKEGFPLPGAYVYVSSPSLLGIRNYITSDTGNFVFLELPSGTYRVTVEMPGFKTVNIERIAVETGTSVHLPVRLEATDVEEEITRERPVPMADEETVKTAFVAGRSLIDGLPLFRSFSEVLRLAPGAIPEAGNPTPYFSYFGASVRSNVFTLDGHDMTDPLATTPMAAPNLDIVEEVEFEAAAHPAEAYPAEGDRISIITRSGSNTMSGGLSVFHTAEGMSKSLWTEAELAELVAPPDPVDKKLWDFSLTMGGPILEDRAWFFSNLRFLYRSKPAPFQTWTDPFGMVLSSYGWNNRDTSGFFKVTSQVTTEFKASAEVAYSNRYQRSEEAALAWNRPEEATRVLDSESFFLARGSLFYTMNQNTFVDLNFGYGTREIPLRLNSAGRSLAEYHDLATGYVWGSSFLNETSLRKRLEGRAVLSRIQERLLGATHEIRAGAEYEDTYADLSTWKENNLGINLVDGSLYAYGQALSPKTGNTVGRGSIFFYIAPQLEGELMVKHELKRLGLFVQDSLSYAGRLTVSLGLRFDRTDIGMPSLSKGLSGNALSVKIGEDVIKPVYGLNPFSSYVFRGWDNLLTWNTLSPRTGLSFDLFGDGRAVLKASWARYAEYPGLTYSRLLEPLSPNRIHTFDWYDEDMNGALDATDTYVLNPDEYAIYHADDYRFRIDADLKAPSTREWTLGIQSELLRDFSISLTFISKTKKDLIDNVLFDPETGKVWDEPGDAAEGWWVPFETTVPGTVDYPDTSVTVFYRSNSAPQIFDRIQNVPQLSRKYEGFSLVARKRMSNNWQFYGSLAWGKATGTAGLDFLAGSGMSPAGDSPNFLVNRPQDSLLDLDRPWSVRLAGSARFPLDFYLSLSFSLLSGTHWARTVTVVPPDAWTLENDVEAIPVTVLLEKPGSHRQVSTEILDMRIEKDFRLGNRTRLRAYLDVLNLLGTKSRYLDLNDGGLWYPDGEGSSTGLRVLSPTFEKYIAALGRRAFQFSVSLEF